MTNNEDNRVNNLIEFIIDFAEKNNITAYQLGKHSKISSSSVNKIFSGENKSPKIKTLLTLQEDLEKMVVGTKNKIELKEEYTTDFRNNLAAETPENYPNFKDLKIDDKLDVIYKNQLINLQKIEIITNAIGNLMLDFEELDIYKKKNKL